MGEKQDWLKCSTRWMRLKLLEQQEVYFAKVSCLLFASFGTLPLETNLDWRDKTKDLPQTQKTFPKRKTFI